MRGLGRVGRAATFARSIAQDRLTCSSVTDKPSLFVSRTLLHQDPAHVLSCRSTGFTASFSTSARTQGPQHTSHDVLMTAYYANALPVVKSKLGDLAYSPPAKSGRLRKKDPARRRETVTASLLLSLSGGHNALQRSPLRSIEPECPEDQW